MAVPSKSLWLFYLFYQLFFKPIKCDKYLFKEILLLSNMCISITLSITGCNISNILCEYKISIFLYNVWE